MPQFAYFCGHEQFQPEVLLEHAVLAESVGFDALTVSDHFHPWVDDASACGFAWTWMGALAARTNRVRIATAVTCPLFHYHPGLIAQAAADTGASVTIATPGEEDEGVDAGSALMIMTLGAKFGDQVVVTSDDEQALNLVAGLVEQDLDA